MVAEETGPDTHTSSTSPAANCKTRVSEISLAEMPVGVKARNRLRMLPTRYAAGSWFAFYAARFARLLLATFIPTALAKRANRCRGLGRVSGVVTCSEAH